MLILDDIYKIIFDLGGCDSKDSYSQGWDDGLNDLEGMINELIERKLK